MIKQTVALCPPAVRMVVIQAYTVRDGSHTYHEVSPVVALAAVPDPDEWEDDGAPAVKVLPVVLSDGHLMTIDLDDRALYTRRVVECHWPAAEDDARLAEDVESVRGQAMEVAEVRRARAAEKAAKANGEARQITNP